jgi:hypothetical protein
MKATAKLLVTALAAAGLGLAAADVHADRGHGGSVAHGSSHGGHWGGYRGSYAGGHWGGYRGGYYGGYRGYWGPRLGFYFGVPVAIGLGYWGYPYYWDYPRETVVYREVVREPDGGELMPQPQQPAQPSSQAAPAPSSGPLYMNYCESAREYYPKITRCPEGWKFVTPTS